MKLLTSCEHPFAGVQSVSRAQFESKCAPAAHAAEVQASGMHMPVQQWDVAIARKNSSAVDA